MKTKILAAAVLLAASSTSYAEASAKEKRVLQNLITATGYTCSSVSFALLSSWTGHYRVTCNNDRYAYEIRDIGGNWTVFVD